MNIGRRQQQDRENTEVTPSRAHEVDFVRQFVDVSLAPFVSYCYLCGEKKIVPSRRDERPIAKKRMSLREETNVPSGRDDDYPVAVDDHGPLPSARTPRPWCGTNSTHKRLQLTLKQKHYGCTLQNPKDDRNICRNGQVESRRRRIRNYRFGLAEPPNRAGHVDDQRRPHRRARLPQQRNGRATHGRTARASAGTGLLLPRREGRPLRRPQNGQDAPAQRSGAHGEIPSRQADDGGAPRDKV